MNTVEPVAAPVRRLELNTQSALRAAVDRDTRRIVVGIGLGVGVRDVWNHRKLPEGSDRSRDPIGAVL